MKRAWVSVTTLVVFAAIAWFCREVLFGRHCHCSTPTSPPPYTVWITTTTAGSTPKCAVDQPRVCLSIKQADRVKWCVDPNTKTDIQLKFEKPTPVVDEQGQVVSVLDIDPGSNGGCSKPIHPEPAAVASCDGFEYDLFYATSQCADPKVILK